MTKFIERLNILVKEKGINATMLARELGIGTSSYDNWRRFNSIPQGKTLIALADYFDVSIDYLVGRKDERE